MQLSMDESLQAYRASLSFTKYLVSRYSFYNVIEFLGAISKPGAAAEDSFRNIFSFSLAEVEADWGKQQ